VTSAADFLKQFFFIGKAGHGLWIRKKRISNRGLKKFKEKLARQLECEWESEKENFKSLFKKKKKLRDNNVRNVRQKKHFGFF
jgi:predicted nuclease of predicted toxin-antitoxin system